MVVAGHRVHGACDKNDFDDYIVLASDDETGSLTSCVHMFFKLVGRDFAEAGAKAPDFADLFQGLGVVLSTISPKVMILYR